MKTQKWIKDYFRNSAQRKIFNELYFAQRKAGKRHENAHAKFEAEAGKNGGWDKAVETAIKARGESEKPLLYYLYEEMGNALESYAVLKKEARDFEAFYAQKTNL